MNSKHTTKVKMFKVMGKYEVVPMTLPEKGSSRIQRAFDEGFMRIPVGYGFKYGAKERKAILTRLYFINSRARDGDIEERKFATAKISNSLFGVRRIA